MVTTNDSFLNLNIVPVTKTPVLYDQDQLYYAIEDEYYQIKDIVDQAIDNLANNLKNESAGNATYTEVIGGYDSLPLNKAGLNTPPSSAAFASTMLSYNSSPTLITFGLPDGYGARYGLHQLPWWDSVIAAGQGQSIPILEKYLSTNSMFSNFAIKTPAFDKAWKDFSDKAWLAQHQVDYHLSQVKSIMTTVQTAVGAFRGWNVNNIPGSLLATIGSIVAKNNMNPLKNISFMNNAFRGLPSILSLSNVQVFSKMSTESIFGADKYISPNARKNIIPMDYRELQEARAEGAIREKLLGEKLIEGDTNSINGESADDIRARIYADYSADQHIQNRMDGTDAGEKPLPNTRVKIDQVDEKGVIIKNPAPEGYAGEYVDQDPYAQGVGGLPGSTDYSPLAVGETAGTPVEKITARAKTGIPTADGNTWGEENPGYNTTYPNNVVYEKNGIVIEVDHTPGSERIQVYHPSHTYIIIDSEGNLKIRNSKNKFEVCDREMKEYIKSNYDRTVDGSKTSLVQGKDTEKVGGDKRITAGMIYLNS